MLIVLNLKMKLLNVFLIYITICDGANILGVFNHPGSSHTFLGKVLLKHLAEKGHNVVMISAFPMKESVPNYRDIAIPELLKDLERRNTMYLNKDKKSILEELRNMTLQHTEDTFLNPQVKKLLESDQTFDVVIMDWFYNEATLIFGHVYNAPVIFSGSFGNNFLLDEVTGNSLPFSYVPGGGLLIHDNMSFKYRVIMTLYNIFYKSCIPRRYKDHHEILKRHFKNPPTIEELGKNVALVLTNSHVSFETPRPYTPNIIPVGGFHIQESKQTISKDLKDFLDGANEGVVYFSLGSQVKVSHFDKEVISNITKALGKLPYKILWKYEPDTKFDLPKNIKTFKWIPQMDVLAHPNVKWFITHGGTLSIIEAVYFAIPLICIPFNGDQPTNAAFIESRNIGRLVLPEHITEDILYNTILEVITNPKYQEQMNYRSNLLREQPIKPIEAAIFWVEHVIKHKGAAHLKPFSTQLPWFKYYLLDVIGFFLCITLVIIKVIFFILKIMLCKFYHLLERSKKMKTA